MTETAKKRNVLRDGGNYLSYTALCLLLATGFAASPAAADDAKSATLRATGYSGTETLTGFPALVKLSASNDAYGFSYSDCVNGKDDLWFTDADGNLIPHDVDTWNASGDSYVWVRFPSLAKNAEIVMHWGATRTAEQTCTPADTWAGYVGVWHMNETGTTAEPDKTANRLDAAPQMSSGASASLNTAAGAVGAGRAISSDGMYFSVGSSDKKYHSTITTKANFSVSGWWKLSNTPSGNGYQRLICGMSKDSLHSWDVWRQDGSNIGVRSGNGSYNTSSTGYGVAISTGDTWHYLTVAWEGSKAKVYKNGSFVAEQTLRDNTHPFNVFTIGGRAGASNRSFVGSFDEVRMYNGVASADRAAADYKTMNEPTTFLTLSSGDMPAVSATLTHRWSFNGDLSDSVGGTTATIKHRESNTSTVDGGNGVSIEDGKAVLTGGWGAGFLNLGAGVLGTGNEATVEFWATRNANAVNWHYVFSYSIPDSGSNLLTVAPGYGSDSRRSCVEWTSSGQNNDVLVGHPIGVTYHYSIRFSGTAARIMVRNAETGFLVKEYSFTRSGWSLSSAASAGCALIIGGNPFTNSTMAAPFSFDEVRVWDGILSDEQLSANALAGPDSVVGGGASGIAVAAGGTFPVDGPGGYGFYTPGAVTLEAGAKIRFDTASWTNYSNRAVMRFKAGSFSLPAGASSVLDFVELTDSTHYTATLEDAATIKIALNSSIPAISIWNGGTPTAESLALASSWTSVDADGNAIDAAPGYGTTIVIPAGSTTFTVPAGYTPEWGRVLFGAGHPATLCGRIASAPDAARVDYIDTALSSYTLLGAYGVNQINSTSSAFVKNYLAFSQLRFDGWFKVEAAQAGKWTVDCHFDDMFALLIDGERILQDPRWDPAIKSGAYVAEGWHRFTLVCGDTSGGYGAGDYSNHPMRISVNGSSSYIYFDGLTSGSGSSTIVLDADCDWSALGLLSLGSGAVIDLNGHNLKLDDMAADYFGAIVTNTSSTTSTMIFYKDPFSSNANQQGIIRGVGANIDLVQDGAKSATWTGGGNDGDPANPDNWEVKLGTLVIGNTVPDSRTAVVMQGQNINMSLAGTALSCSSFQIGNCTFAADCDWRGLSVTPDIVGTADLAGHNLQLNDLAPGVGSSFANSSATASQVRLPVAIVNGAVTDEGLDNLSVASNVQVVMINNGSTTASANSQVGNVSGGTSSFVQTTGGSLNATGKTLELGKKSGGTGLFRIESGTVSFGGISAQSVAGAHALVELAGGELQTGWLDLGNNSSGSATINQTGGTFTGTGNIWLGRNSGGTGVYNLTGGTFGTGVVLGQVRGTTGRMTVGGAGVANLTRGGTVGAEGVGYLTITNGGTVTASSFLVGGNNLRNYANAAGTVTLTGGELNVTGTVGLVVGQYKTGTLDIGGDGVVNASAGVKLGNQTSGSGTLLIRENGVLSTSGIGKGFGAASITFDGGTIRATGDNATGFLNGLTNISVRTSGLTLDTAGYSIGTTNCTFLLDEGAVIAVAGNGTFDLSAARIEAPYLEGCTNAEVVVAAADTARISGLPDGSTLPDGWHFENSGRILKAVRNVKFTVTFDLGEHGAHMGGGELTQFVEANGAAVAPEVRNVEVYDFDGWDVDFSHVVSNMTVRAKYVRLRRAVAVEGLDVDQIANTGTATDNPGASIVDFSFNVSCDDPAQTNYVYFVARDEATGAEYPIRSIDGNDVYTNGRYRVSWNASADLPAGIVGNIRIHAFATAHPLAHRWGFNGNYFDTAGTMDAIAKGNVSLADGVATLAGGTNGTSYIMLGQEVFPGANQPRTVEVWGRQNAVRNWSRIFDFGRSETDFIAMGWSSDQGINSDFWRVYGIDNVLNTMATYTLHTEYHIVMTLSPLDDGNWNVACYKFDTVAGTCLNSCSTNIAGYAALIENAAKTLYLGRSFFSRDDDASASYDEVRIWNAALRETELKRNSVSGVDLVSGATATTSAAFPVVTFDLGGYATRTGGGELVQMLLSGTSAAAPEVAADFGWLFAGWSESFTNVVASLRVEALYEDAFPFAATNAMDGVAYNAAFGNLTGITNLTWSANGLPEGLAISADGTISGTVLRTGAFSFSVTVTAPNGASRTIPVSLHVAENPNHRPVVSGTLPAELPDLTMPGDVLEFNVAASDPDGDAISYIWLIDGVTNAVNTTGAFTWTPQELDGGTRIVTCLVSDGFWDIPANGGWRVSIPKWYVAGDGVSTNAGTTASTPFREIQTAVAAAAEGDVIFVAEGVYGPISTANKGIRVIATGGIDKTVIDGGGTNRCVYVGNQWVNYIPVQTNACFEGFTIRNGYAYDENGCGGAVSGGKYVRCVLQGNRVRNDKWGGATHRAVLHDCLIVGNFAGYGGGVDSSSLYNCTVVSNTASASGGGIYNVHARNSIVWDNICAAGNSYSNNYNGIGATIAYSCIAPAASGAGNISLDPYFTDPVNGDYRLRQYSPCLDAGNNAYAVGDSDLAGTNRICDAAVDMGCYEGWVYLPLPEVVEGLAAEDGTRIGIVRLAWDVAGYAKAYKVYRAGTNNADVAELIGTSSALFFDDETAEPETEYWYWVKGVNPAGEGPFGMGDTGWCMAPMVFGTNGLAVATAGLPYREQLAISGGSGHYFWTSGADDYDVDGWESTYLMDIVAPRGLLFGDDVSTAYPLPFDFPFYGKSYNKLWISSNGTLTFDGEFRTYTPSLDVFKSRVMIAPFWKDLLQGSGGVYVSENGGESVTFLWYNGMYYSGHGLVNASVTLFADGSVVCSYGDGNASGAFVGVSAGDGTRYRHFDRQGTSLNNADDIVFFPQDVPGGLTLGEDGTLSGTPTAPGEYVFTVFATDEYGNGATRQVSVTVEENPNMRTVTFDLGEYGVRSGGGDLHQYVLLGESATAPSVRSRAGWVFDGWNGSFTNIPDSVTVAAKYRSAYADLYVDAIDVTNSVAAGEALSVRWTVGNTGNPSFNGRMTERISLVSANNPDDVRVIASPVFEGTVARDGSVERDATIEVPLKGWDGVWYVRIETAVNPSVQEYAVNNVATNDTTLEITAVPLPNLMVGEISGDVNLVPGKTATFSFTTTNSGAATASAPWMERIYLESVDSGIAVKVGDISRTNDLDSASAINGEYLLTIPEFISVAGAVRVKVVADANGDVVESDDDDNVAYGVGTLSLATNLYLTAASTSAYENISGSGVRFTVRRSGPTTEAMTVTLGNSDATSASIPATVTIPAGSVSMVFYVKPIDNATVEGPRTVTVSASAGDCRPASLALTILDNEVPKLTVTLDKTSIREGDGVILATVTRELVTDEPLTVYLAGASTSRCSYPSSVVVPAGEASVTFEISVPNNETAQIAQELTLRASSSGYTSAAVTYTVDDDDVPGVTLSLTPEVVSEGAGAQAIYATLMRSDTNQIAQAVRIRLTASEANQLILPNEITIPKYTMAVRFAIGVIDNALDDGDREIDIDGAIVIESCGCNGQSSNGDVIHATVDIIDNDGPALALKADPTTMKEGFDPAGYLVLSHNSTLTEDLTVRLWVDAENEDEIVIPETVTIHAGETSVRIPVATLDDGVEDGGQLVSVYVEDESDVFAPASTWVQVSDQNLPDLTVVKIETVASVVAMENFTASFAVTNTGFMATSKAVPYAVHLVKGASANAISSATLVKSGTLTGGIDVGDALYGTVPLTAPEMPGDYRVAVVVDPDGTISELDSANNTGWSSAIGVTVAYTATAGVDKKVYMSGETVTITGVVSRADGTTAGNVQIDPYVMLSGMRRSLLTTTAADGSYSATFTPTSGEAGDYSVGACYPGVNSKVAQDSFSIIGMKRSSTANVIWDIALGDSATRTVTIQNRSAVPLTGLTVTFTDVPEECGFTYSLPDTIPANGSVVLTLTATATGVTEQEDYKKFYAHILSAEGVSLDFPLYFHSQAQQAYLRATPTSINTTMAIGQTRYIEVTLVNDGKGDSGAVSVSVPDVNWLKIVSGASIDNLASGESATVTLALSPTAEDELTLNSPLSGGRMAVNCANGTGCSVSLKFTPVSEVTGSITVDAVDNNTYTLESAPHLSNATVRVSNPYTGATVATGKTGADGIWTVDGIPEGTYQLIVTAPNHDTYADAITVEPGRNVRKEAFLQYQLVTVSWNVEKTEVEDAYDIQLLLDFETHVPAPIVKTHMPGELPTLNSGESYAFIVLLENTGLIAAERVSLTMPDIPGYDFTLLDNGVAVPAKSSVSIAVVFSRGASRAVSATATKCVYAATTVVEYPCGREHPRYSYPTTVRHGQCVAETGGIWIPEYNFPDESVEGEPGRGGVTIWEPEDFIGGGSTTYRKVGCSPEDADAVCASVTLKLSQTLAMTREAFDGTLTLYNGNTTAPITNLKLDVSVLDEDGNECRDLFEIFANGTSGSMSEGSVLAGGISVTAGGTGSAMIRFIPERGAAPAVEKLYRFGGTVTYTDPFSGETATVKLTPVSLTVSPSPYLHLDYFVQRDVFADDPFTANTVEASMPAELAVLVRNVGAGNANKVTIASAQPEMVQNEKGLLVDFDLKDYSLDKAALNGATANLLLSVVSLGTIVPNESKVAQWWLTSTIEGHFIGMSATVTPVNSWNTPDTMLVDPNVGVHKLVRSIVADGDTLPDFLVCDGSDLYGTPNEIYTAVGYQLPVYVASVAPSATLPAGGEIVLPLSLTPARSGWNYGYATIPGIFRYTISRIVRGDGTEISLRNAWITDRTFRDGNTPLLEDRLHIVDEFTSGSDQTYTVYLLAKPSDVPEVVAFEGVTDGSIEYSVRNAVTVVFSKPIDPATFTVDDLTLVKQGSYLNDISALTVTPADDSGTRFIIGNLSALCSGYGRYELTVQCAGIADTVGQLGTVGKSVAWTYATAEAPYVIGADGVPVRRVQSLDTISVTFSAPIKPETFTSAALRMNNVAVGSSVNIAALDASGTRFSVSGLSSAQTADGEYTLAVDATAVAGLDDTPGVNAYTATWTRDTVAPVLQSLAHEDGLNGNEFTLTFSEDVTSESLTPGGATIKRNGASVALPATASLRRVGDNAPYQYVLAGIDSVLSEDGAYELTFSSNGITDEAGNVASGSKSVSWTVDRTPPAQITDLAISPDGGFSDADGITYTGALTVSGTLPEAGLTVEIVAKYVGGGETVLTMLPTAGGDTLPAGAFSQNIVMPGTGNATLVVRLTDAAGNSSDSEKGVSVDGIALTGTLTGASDDEGVVMTTATLEFSAKPMDADVTFDKFALTRDGEAIALEGVMFTKVDDTTFTLTGLDSLCAEDGVYVLTFNGSAVRKYTSGLLMSGSLVMRWRYENPDREPPTVTEVLFDGEAPREAYTNVFSSVSVAFSEAVNVPDLIVNGLIDRAARIDLLDAAGAVTGCVAVVRRDGGIAPYQWNAESNTLSWVIDAAGVPAGRARLMLDAGLIKDLAGNALAAGQRGDGEGAVVTQAANGMRAYVLSETALAQVNAQAMPTWHDGELYIGEKTADNKGKIRRYAANGTWSYLQSEGVDIEIPAQGCQGASVAFADMDGDGVAEIYVGTTGGDVLKYPGGAVVVSLGANRAMPYAFDVDGDGRDELVVGGIDGRIRVVWRRVEDNAQTYATELLADADGAPLSVPNGRAAPVVGDINHDGIADIVSGDTAGNIWAFLGAGMSSATIPAFAPWPICVFTNSVSLADRSRIGYGDVDGDGIADLIVGRSDGSVTVMSGAETLSPVVPFAVKAVVSASADAHGSIVPAGDMTYDGGDEPEYVIAPDVGYRVADVKVDGVSAGATNSYVFAPLAASHSIHADFAAIPYAITYTGLKGASNLNPAVYTVEDEIVFTAPGEVYGWVFKGWTPASIALGSTGAVEVAANWERQKFDVTVNGETKQYDYEEEVTFTAPEPFETNGMQVVTFGTTFTDPVVTNEFTVAVTNGIEFAWDIFATNWWFATAETENGSITAPEAGWMADGTNFTLVAIPAEHYHFVGWTGDTEGCTATNGTELSIVMDRPRTIGATFAIDEFTVTFEAGAHGALSGETSQTLGYGESAVAPDVAPDAGYEFIGWSGDVSAPVTSNVTFTAQYAAIPHAITYTGLKGASNTNPETYTVEDEVVFVAPGEVYGWVFKGWTPASIAAGSTGAVEVAANWERRKFDVTVNGETKQYDYEEEVTFTVPEPFETNGVQVVTLGTTFTDPVVTNEFTVAVTNGIEFAWDIFATNWWFATAETENGSITAPEAGWKPNGDTFVIDAVPAEHYHFVGWTGDTEGCTATNGTELSIVMDRPRTIGATFAIDEFTVTFEAGAHGALSGETSQTLDYGGVAVVPTVAPDAGYEFTGWSGDVSAPVSSNVTFTAQYETVPYAITYTGLKGASNPNSATYTVEDEIVFTAPGEMYGWVFKGWTPASIAVGSTGAVEVAANWERQKFDVTVNGETRQYDYEEEVTFNTPEPSETNGMQVVTLGTTFTDPIVTNEFTVAVTNGIEFAWDIFATNWWFATAETENGSITALEAGWMADGTNFTLVAIPAEHCHFVGWTGDMEGCTATNGTELSIVMDRPRTIGATFAIDAFTVVFEAGAHGALTGETSQTLDYGGVAVAPAVAPDTGYEFTGWSGDVSAPVTSNATFTAQYAAIPYAITCTGLKGASNTNPETYTVEDEIVFTAPGEVYGWVFKGWTPASIAAGSTGAVEVAANWERRKFDVTVNGETKQYDYEEEVSLATNAAINCGATQYVCKGWTAVNAEPESGDGANAKFKVLGDVSFAWLWETNVVTLAQSVNAENLEWTAGGAAEWLPEWSEEAADGLHQAYCEAIPNGTNAWIATTVEGPGTIVFKWCSALAARNTKFQFMVDGEVKGMLSGTNGWTETSVTVLGAWKHEVRWRLMSGRSGAVAGDRVALDCVAWTPSAPPASSVSPTLAEALNTNLVWTTDGDVVWHGVAWQSPTDAREAWAEVSGLGDGGTAAVQTRVYGSGVLSFDWAVSCEEDYDWMELSVDGEVRGYVSGEADWTKYAVEIAGDGWHVVRWEFLKDEMDDPELAGANVARLDNVEWKSGDVPPALEETQTTPVPVPYAVLESEHFAHYLDLADGDYEAAAHSVGANGYAVWESYLAGLEPDNANSKFIAKIEMLLDGTPKVTWEPDTPELRATRTYIKYGKRRLDDREEVWTPIDDAVDGSVLRQYNFFKVEVKLKE